MKPIIRVSIIAVSLLISSQLLYAQEPPQPQENEDGVIQTAETPSTKIDGIKNELSKVDKKDLLKEVELLRKLNAELETYIPVLKERNNHLEAEAENLKKEKEYILAELKKLKQGKPVISKDDYAKLKRDNKVLQKEVNRLTKANSNISPDAR